MLWPYVVLIAQTLLEARLDRPRPPRSHVQITHMPYPDAYEFPSANGTKIIISPEDRELVESVSNRWRVSSSGYVVSSTRKDKKYHLLYLHKLVAGGSAKHINSNRMDNRRINLVQTKPRVPKKRPFEMDTNDIDFEISTVGPFLDHVLKPSEVPENARQATVDYGNNKVYRGSYSKSRPHGYGSLYEISDMGQKKATIGLWKNGYIESGITIVFKPVPAWMKMEFEDYEIQMIYQTNINKP